ncbi:pancreatic secretory granule membrane major glycoprotein GP2-like [Montipora capricornis]|uniref:pancreatic secretory granule membrane major glycoprotein GP2-like n=1 Tax=Montipora capricornis TaxID=246305 RepID=UPI0035F14864
MKVLLFTIQQVLTFMAIVSNREPGSFANQQEVIYEPVGCFKDDTSEPRPLPVLVKNFRRPPQVDWNNLNNTIKACAERVKKAGYLYFGLQFYGECWSGPRAYLTYDEDGKSNRCEYGVGKGFANFVYRLVFEECNHYRVLDTADRSIHHVYDGKASCDVELLPSWYRFQGAGGNAMANSCPGPHKCGTLVPGWLKGELPTIQEGLVERKACFRNKNDCCDIFVPVKVRDCGGFHVYKLSPAPKCQLRYCGNGIRD